MAGFRSLWRGERGRAKREEAEGASGRGANGRERPERAEREPGERAGYGGEDFRYRPESRRHRYPEGLYSGIGRESASRAAEPDPVPRHNGREPLPPRPDREFERASFERPIVDHPDYDQDEDDRDLPDDTEPRAREAREINELPSGPHRGRGPRGYRRSDERIREDVCDRLTEDPEIDASDIEVLVAGGEVTLNGSVDTRLIRRLAEDIADTVSGVTLVQNNLKIGPPGNGASPDEPLTADPGLAGRRRT